MRQTRLQHDPGRAIPALRGDLGVAWHGSDGFVVPERLWELVGRAAWTSPGFQADASRILTGHLRKRLLVGADDFPVPRLRVEILWLLVVAAPIRETLLTRQQCLGYTSEDLIKLLLPMATSGLEPGGTSGTRAIATTAAAALATAL